MELPCTQECSGPLLASLWHVGSQPPSQCESDESGINRERRATRNISNLHLNNLFNGYSKSEVVANVLESTSSGKPSSIKQLLSSMFHHACQVFTSSHPIGMPCKVMRTGPFIPPPMVWPAIASPPQDKEYSLAIGVPRQINFFWGPGLHQH